METPFSSILNEVPVPLSDCVALECIDVAIVRGYLNEHNSSCPHRSHKILNNDDLTIHENTLDHAIECNRTWSCAVETLFLIFEVELIRRHRRGLWTLFIRGLPVYTNSLTCQFQLGTSSSRWSEPLISIFKLITLVPSRNFINPDYTKGVCGMLKSTTSANVFLIRSESCVYFLLNADCYTYCLG